MSSSPSTSSQASATSFARKSLWLPCSLGLHQLWQLQLVYEVLVSTELMKLKMNHHFYTNPKMTSHHEAVFSFAETQGSAWWETSRWCEMEAKVKQQPLSQDQYLNMFMVLSLPLMFLRWYKTINRGLKYLKYIKLIYKCIIYSVLFWQVHSWWHGSLKLCGVN